MVTGAGIEPAARALKVRCSTTELPGPTVASHKSPVISQSVAGRGTGDR